MSHTCSVNCASPETTDEYCFHLNFTPHNIVATSDFGRVYVTGDDAANRVEAKIPAVEFGNIRGGCPAGYLSAEVRAFNDSGGVTGLYILFN